MGPGCVPIGGDDHAFARRQSVVFDHPGPLARRRAEPIQCGVEMGRAVDDFAGRCRYLGGGHDVLGESFGTLDPGGRLRWTEAGDSSGADGIGDAESQWHLGADHHQVSAYAGGECGDVISRGDVDVELLGHRRRARVPRRDREVVDAGVLAQSEQQGVFAGTGSDHKDAHGDHPNRLIR